MGEREIFLEIGRGEWTKVLPIGVPKFAKPRRAAYHFSIPQIIGVGPYFYKRVAPWQDPAFSHCLMTSQHYLTMFLS